ncbi:MAG: DUF4476 domain-containing protein [Bacteroidia bacterium]|nr:DUF4476 domain-containing protein [Bacteroidia bacterium]
MKKIFLLTFAVFASVLLNAQGTNNPGQLVIFSEQGERFRIVLNGLLQNDTARTNIRLRDLSNEYYACKIMFEDKSIPDIDKTYLPTPFATEVTYKIKQNNKGKYVLNYQSETPLATAMIRPPMGQTVISYNPAGLNMNLGSNGAGMGGSVNIGGYNVSGNINISPNNGYGYQQPPIYYVPGYSGMVGCAYPMDPMRFDQLKQSIASKPFEETRLQIAQQALRGNCVTTAQVRDLMGLFTFEGTKLDFAKQCYDAVYDVQNYYMVNDAFTFSSSIDDLNSYIQGHPRQPYQYPVDYVYPQNGYANPGYQQGGYNQGGYQQGGYQQGGYQQGGYQQNGYQQGGYNTQMGFNQNGMPVPQNCMRPMDNYTFQGVKTSVSKQSFDDSKMQIAKQVLNTNCLTTSQIKELLQMLTFEKNRLELAKYCYRISFDPQNYFQLNDVFTFKSSVDELVKYTMTK